MKPAESDILAKLREATASQHAALEREVRILSPDFTLSDYVHLLERFYGYFQPLEAAIVSSGVERDVFPFDSHSAWLAADLAALGRDPATAPLAPVTELAPAPALGARYVLEGATLGGQVILPRLVPKFVLTPGNGARYYTGYGLNTREHWLMFRNAVLAYHASRPGAESGIIQGASACMGGLLEWLKMA